MVDIPSPPPRRDDLKWKVDVLQYATDYFPGVLPVVFSEFLGYSNDIVEQYIRAVHAAKSEADRHACKSFLGLSDAPQLSPKLSSNLSLEADDRSDFLKAFSDEYKDDRSCLKTFTEFIDTCAVGWRRANYLAPYTSLVQSSGTGKSRLLKEFANDRYVIYCCVRTRGSSGIPARSWIADKLVPATDPSQNNEQERLNGSLLYASFICACIDHLAHSMETNITPKEWCEKQLEEGVKSGGAGGASGVAFWEAILERMSKFEAEVREQQGRDDGKPMMELLGSKIRQSCLNFVKRCKASMVFSKGRALLTFAMDEARSLLDSYGGTTHFSIFRWMASYLEEGCGIFIVLLDTASKISNFMPSTVADGSYRYSSRSNQLLPPFYTVNTFNVLAPKGRIWNGLGDPTGDMTRVLTSHFKKGRPLFGSYIQSGSNVKVTDLVRLAVAKLLGGITVTHNMHINVDHKIAVALLSVRAAVFVKPQSELASSLVASHLGMCLAISFAISSDRRLVFTGYPSEPVLAEAACHIMNRGSKLDLGEIFDPVLPYLREGVVEGGARGELVARILFLLAWDHACREDMSEYEPRFAIFGTQEVLYSRPLMVREFLKSLADEHLLDAALKGQIDKQEMEKFLTGRVLFTHFISVAHRIERSALIDYYESSAAIVCKRGETGFDLIIPVWLCKDVMSYILVQVRNYSHSDPHYKWASLNVRPEIAGLEVGEAKHPYLVLYVQLGYDTARIYNLKYEMHEYAEESAKPLAKRGTEDETQQPTTPSGKKRARSVTQQPTTSSGKKRARRVEKSVEERREDPFQMIIGLFSLKPAIYPFLRDEKKKVYGALEDSMSSRLLSSVCRAWTDPLNYVQSDKSGQLGETKTMKEAKCSFVKDTCVLTYESSSSGSSESMTIVSAIGFRTKTRCSALGHRPTNQICNQFCDVITVANQFCDGFRCRDQFCYGFRCRDQFCQKCR